MPNYKTQVRLQERIETHAELKARWESWSSTADKAVLDGDVSGYFEALALMSDIEADMRKLEVHI